MINCADNTYYIYYTDASTGAIAIPIPKSALLQDLDITLLGKTRLEYGEVFNGNMLHLLEHFASPSDDKLIPDQTQTYANLLANPVIGQLWYNSTFGCVNVCVNNDPIEWVELPNVSKIAGNSGILSHGEYIPLPIANDGYEFQEEECVWHVSPYYLSPDEEVLSFDIRADNRLVTCVATTASGTRTGLVNYIIMGIRDYAAPARTSLICPTPTPTPTISVTPTFTPTVTPTFTPTVTPSETPAVTPTETPSVTPTITPSETPVVTPTPTVTPSGT